ncbi:DUF1254 domain-containing protein [Parahaliea aestuarii]|uniref:DUF1254 domain-containing protein n=1 Tax=Parahaliea aestuarii TaxID=1852021 RepID=A0A5C9A780_9GAMM|nr:DUF1214 domain-containing protein [Parahaliea aestuarii]TXS95071.1 DUF1254 domain-containing protein [Parahaliea aestuarii]
MEHTTPIRTRPGLTALLAFTLSLTCFGQVGNAAEDIGSTPGMTYQSNDAIFAGETDDPYRLALRAYIWGYPLVKAAAIRMAHTNPDDPYVERAQPSAAGPLNTLNHSRELFGPEFRNGVGVNHDTLYSFGWFDLEDEAWVLEAPDFGDRYYTFSIYNADSSSADTIGQRTHGSQLPTVLIHGPLYDGPVPDDMLAIGIATRYLNFAGRILTSGTEEDYRIVHSLQDRIRMRPLDSYLAGKPAPASVPDQTRLSAGVESASHYLQLYAQLGNVLRDWIPAAEEQSLLRSFEEIGLSAQAFHIEGLENATLDAMKRAARDASELIARRSRDLGSNHNGWTINYLGSRFGTDYLLRAAVARDQIYVTVPEEAIYPITRLDANGEPLHGDQHYRISLPADALPPVKGFWSITLYNDSGYLVENPIGRYTIGDRTPGLVSGDDGTIDIRIQRDAPDTSAVNWLPAPAGEFYLMMRLYIPERAILEREWLPPPVMPVDHTEE